jgi:hypothetical protein
MITFTNPFTSFKTANSFVFSIKTCSAKLASWRGGRYDNPLFNDVLTQYIISNSPDQSSLLIGKVVLNPGMSYQIGICVYDAAASKGGLSVNDLFFGVDLSDSTTPCNGPNCVLTCGDNQCPNVLSPNTCPIGCTQNACTRTIASKNAKKGIADGMNVWTGTPTIQTTSSTSTMYCGEIFISHSNANFQLALSHVLTLEFYSYNAKIKSIDADYDFSIVKDVSNIIRFRQVANDVAYSRNTNYQAGAFCLELRPNIPFNVNSHVRVSVDLRDLPTLCDPKLCVALCSKTCTSNWGSNCPLDCQTNLSVVT